MAATTTPTSSERQHYALQTIFSFFLGLLVLAVVGVGVNTFYQSPSESHQKEMTEIQRQMETLNFKSPNGVVDAADKAELARLQTKQNALQDIIDAEMKIWARNTSIVLVLFATAVMGVSLIRSEQLRVISNGLLLGGLFTMLYGAGWVIFSGNSTARFVVVLFALAVALGLGYLKFVRNRENREVAGVTAAGTFVSGGTGALDDAAVAALAQRVAAIEQRMSAASAAFSGDDSEEK